MSETRLDRRTRKVLSDVHDMIVELLLLDTEDVGEVKARLRHILVPVNILLVESKERSRL